MTTLLTTLLMIDAIVIILLVVALQQGNEGGIGSAFGSGDSAGFFGASGGVTFIVRATWVAGALFFILTTSLAWVKTHDHFGVGRELDSLVTEGAGDTAPASIEAVGTDSALGTAVLTATETSMEIAPAEAATVVPAETPAPTVIP